MNADKIKELIKTDAEYTVGALITLYNLQNTDERQGKQTAYQNDVGFNKIDAQILSDISDFYLKKGWLSDKQIRLIRQKLTKYSKQLSEFEVKPLPIKTAKKTEKKSNQKIKQATKESDTVIKVEFTFDQEFLKEIQKINGRKFITDEKYWTVPLTVNNLDKLVELGFTLDEELSKWHDAQTNGITENFSVPGLDDVLRPFQKIAVSFIETRNGRALIADEMGLGKTLEALAWMQLHGEAIYPIIIVCPSSLKLNWLSEIAKFTDLDNDVEILSGQTPYKISKPILIINYDILWHWSDHILQEIKPKLIIADEIHYCKSRGTGFKTVNGKQKKVILTQRSTALEKLAKKTDHFIGLTGTPILNRPVEIYNPLKMIKPTLFPNFKAFAYKYCNPSFNGFGMNYNGASNTTELNQVLTREVMIRRKKEDVLKELPPKTRTLVPLEIDNGKEYRQAHNHFIQYLTSIDPEKAKRAKRAETLTQLNTLRQLAVQGKMSSAIEWIENFLENDKLVLFTYHHKTVDAVMKKFSRVAVKLDGRDSGAKKKEAEEKFQYNEDVRLLVGQIKAAGVGRTLTASSNVAFLEYPWSPGEYAQAEDRSHRIGQEDNVMIWNLIAAETIEKNTALLLEEKAKVISAVIDGDESEDSGIFNKLIEQLVEG